MTDPASRSSTAVCANGHASTERDYCSVCGTKIEGVPGGAAPGPPASPAAGSAPSAGGSTCPNCSTQVAPDTRFCEVCGYDSTTGSLPQAPVVQPADPLPPASTSTSTSADPAAAASGTWIAVVTADRAYYDRNQVSEVQFPLGVPERTIELQAGAAHDIGRRSRSRGTDPAIDLGGPPEDAAVSHIHASLLAKDDGTWELVDHGSTNGTFVDESSDPVAPNTPHPLAAGDCIYVGAWTKITLVLRPDP
jgi:hypothetical protein